MKFLSVVPFLFLGALAVPASQCDECDKHHGGGDYPGGHHPGGGDYPGGHHPGGNNPGGNNPGGNNPGGNNPGGNNPGGNNPGGNEPACPKGLYSNPQCCATGVLGVADLDCDTPDSAKNAGDFQQSCSAAGKSAKCCVLPVAGQALLCTDAPGGGNNPGGNNPGGNNPGGNNPGGNNPGGNNPGGNNPGGDEPVCPEGLYSNPQCCATDVLGVADLDCKTPSSAKNPGDFKKSCSGKTAKCCAVPVAGQALLCTDPLPGGNNPGGNNPGGNNPGGNNPGGNNPGGNNPGGNNPGGNNPGGNEPACPKGLYSNPQCCSTDVLGVADLDCDTPSSAKNAGDLKQSCSAAGKEAKCCVIPVAGQALLCTDAPGGGNNPGGNNPGGNNPGGNNPGGNNPGGNNPGGNNPGGNNPGGNNPGGKGDFKCPSGLYSQKQCCATQVLGLLALDCESPTDGSKKSSCGSKEPLCCVVPVAGQNVLCVEPSS